MSALATIRYVTIVFIVKMTKTITCVQLISLYQISIIYRSSAKYAITLFNFCNLIFAFWKFLNKEAHSLMNVKSRRMFRVMTKTI